MKRTLTILFAAAICALGIFSAVAFGAGGVPVVTTTTTTPVTTDTTTTTQTTTTGEDHHGGLCVGKRVHVFGTLVALTDSSVSLTVTKSSGNSLSAGTSVTFSLVGKKRVKVEGNHHSTTAPAAGSFVAVEGALCSDGTYQAKKVEIRTTGKGENGSSEHGKTHHGHGESTPPLSTTPDTQTTPSQSGDSSESHGKGHHGGK